MEAKEIIALKDRQSWITLTFFIKSKEEIPIVKYFYEGKVFLRFDSKREKAIVLPPIFKVKSLDVGLSVDVKPSPFLRALSNLWGSGQIVLGYNKEKKDFVSGCDQKIKL